MAIGQSPKDNSRCAIEKAQVQAAMRLLEGKKSLKQQNMMKYSLHNEYEVSAFNFYLSKCTSFMVLISGFPLVVEK